MLKRLLPFFALLLVMSAKAQDCPVLISPVDGATNTSVGTAIEWAAVTGITSYKIQLGTSPGASDILAERPIGNSTIYQPELGLPGGTQIFVTVILDFPFSTVDDIVCNVGSFTTETITTVPDCSQMLIPTNGAAEVSVFSNISWSYATRADSYRIILTDASLGTEISNEVVTGLSFNPATSLPPETTIEVEIIPLNIIGARSGCTSFEFTTGVEVALPSCSGMISPINGEINVELTPTLEWIAVPGATGYRVTITKTPTPQNPEDFIIDQTEFPSNSTPILELEPNTTYFIQIVPFNLAGDAIGCTTIESFSTEIGCGPYFDPVVGDFVTLGPEATLPSVVSICENNLPFTVVAPDLAEGYRWYSIRPNGRAELIGETASLEINRVGRYAYEPYNFEGPANDVECANYMEFEVFSSEIATIDRIRPALRNGRLELRVEVRGKGEYEYSLDASGTFQDSPFFEDLEVDSYTIYVRDKQGCGTASLAFQLDNSFSGFPAFFTPNGDSINEFWQYQPPPGDTRFFTIRIFDRYGKFLRQFSSAGPGWDGTHVGRPLPSSDYWFMAVDQFDNMVKGHFSLRR